MGLDPSDVRDLVGMGFDKFQQVGVALLGLLVSSLDVGDSVDHVFVVGMDMYGVVRDGGGVDHRHHFRSLDGLGEAR